MDKKILDIAAEALGISQTEADKNYSDIPEIDAYYFWNPVRGGQAVIINKAGERLVATSSVTFQQHLDAFKSGNRN